MKKLKSTYDKRKMQTGGTAKPPITVSDPNDPRLKAYQDSTALYNNYLEVIKALKDQGYEDYNTKGRDYNYPNIVTRTQKFPNYYNTKSIRGDMYSVADFIPGIINPKLPEQLYSTRIQPNGVKGYDKEIASKDLLTWSNDNIENPIKGSYIYNDKHGTDIDLRLVANYSNAQPKGTQVLYQPQGQPSIQKKPVPQWKPQHSDSPILPTDQPNQLPTNIPQQQFQQLSEDHSQDVWLSTQGNRPAGFYKQGPADMGWIPTRQNGGLSMTGYRNNSPHRDRDFNIIPSGNISMKNVNFPVYGEDNTGFGKVMMPGGEYQFPGHSIHEIPLKGYNMKKMKNGGAAEGHPGMYWNGERWVSSANGATYSNGVFYATGGKYSQEGGPTFPIAGAGPMFRMGGSTASFYIDGNGYPRPFAMDPGTGHGSGMLEDYANEHMQMGGIPGAQQINPFAINPGTGMGGGMLEEYATETMKKGGKHKGKPKLSPQQMQMMMQAMQGQQAPPGMGQPGMGAPMGQPPMGMMPPQGGIMPPQGGGQPMPGMAHGGIHIKPSHKGRFTAYKERTGKTTEEALHSKDPHVRQMANFARNAAKWHHEFGGPAMQMGGGVTQGGNMVRDNEMYSFGGGYHPLAKFMQGGGPNDPIGGGMNLNAPAANGDPNAYKSGDQSMADVTGQQTPTTPDAGPMPEQGGYEAAQGPAYEGNMDQQQDQKQPTTDGPVTNKRRNGYGWGIAGAGMAALGVGMGIASYFSNQRDARNLRNKQFNDRSTVNQYAAMNQPGGMGDYDQYGTFRPNSNTPTRAGYFPPNMAQNGGIFAMGGMYQAGGEYEMDDAEIARLKKMGYKIDML